MRKTVAITLVIPDASPLLTLGRVRRLDVLSYFKVPIHIVDVVAEEAQRPPNDLNGAVRAWFAERSNLLTTVETTVGLGLAARRARGETPSTRDFGELAVEDYATSLPYQGEGKTLPLVLFEDPDVLESRLRKAPNVHLLNTAALLLGLKELGLMSDAVDVLAAINEERRSPMLPFEEPARTRKIQSTFLKAVGRPQEIGR